MPSTGPRVNAALLRQEVANCAANGIYIVFAGCRAEGKRQKAVAECICDRKWRAWRLDNVLIRQLPMYGNWVVNRGCDLPCGEVFRKFIPQINFNSIDMMAMDAMGW